MKIAVVDYPDVLKSAVFGLEEMFLLANSVCLEQNIAAHFEVDIIKIKGLTEASTADDLFTAVVIPPGMENDFYLHPDVELTDWLTHKHKQGSILCSACAGTFIIAPTGLLDGRRATTHWRLAALFSERYPQIELDPDKIIINERDIITAGGMMSWLDLGLALVESLVSPYIVRQLGKLLVIDTAGREQRYYQQFSPVFTHGDSVILRAQQSIQRNHTRNIKISVLADDLCLTERTFLRRFLKATGLKPSEYIQRLRIQKACDLLETTQRSFELIANDVGYKDTSACRKVFVQIMGLTPRAFKNRFVGD